MGSRTYHSRLRAEHAEETRARILDATLRVMAVGMVTLSVPDVAREAGVSVATVYRHFGTKRALLAAVYPHIARRAGIGQVAAPESVEDFREMVRNIFGRLHAMGAEARIAMTSPVSEEARRTQMPARYAMSRGFAAAVMPAASEVDRDRLARVLIILASSSAMRLWLDHLGSSVDEAADDVDWLIRKVISATPGGPRGA